MKAEILAVDIDGTLLNDELKITDATKKSVREYRKKGGRIVLCSGRMCAALKTFWDELELDEVIIGYNGAMVFDHSGGRMVLHHPVPADAALEAVNYLASRKLHYNLYVDDYLYVSAAEPYGNEYAERNSLPCKVIENENQASGFCEKGTTKILVIDTPENTPGILSEVKTSFNGRLEVTGSQNNYIEIMAPGVNKGKTLLEIAKREGVAPDKIAAAGDGLNDMEMLKAAAYTFAPANAVPEIKNCVNEVVSDNNSGTIPDVISKIM